MQKKRRRITKETETRNRRRYRRRKKRNWRHGRRKGKQRMRMLVKYTKKHILSNYGYEASKEVHHVRRRA